MGREARCVGSWKGSQGEGKLLLETTELIFRGPFRLVMPFAKIENLRATADAVELLFEREPVRFELGSVSATWVKAIREPKGRLDKLGIKAEQRVALIGFEDSALQKELEARGAKLSRRPTGELDHLFFAIASERDLQRLGALKDKLKPAGALWVLRPKGPDGVSERATMAAGKAAGLVDVKVVGFDATYSAEKFVIPVANRKKA
jgi:hypothetical protein